MGDVVIDKERFYARMARIFKFWDEGDHRLLNGVAGLVVPLGKSDGAPYSTNAAIHTWLFGYELTDTVIVITKKKVTILTSKKKCDFLQRVVSDSPPNDLPSVTCLQRDKSDNDSANFEKMIEQLKEAGGDVGEVPKGKVTSDFIDLWRGKLEEASLTKDVAAALSIAMAPKEPSELDLVRTAVNATVAVWNKSLRKRLIDIIDRESKVRHEKLAEECETAFTDRKIVGGINVDHLESCYTPIIQSGESVSLKMSAQSDRKHANFAAVAWCQSQTLSLGGRYHDYCSNLARTLFLEPSDKITAVYESLLAAEEAVIAALKPGAKLCDAYKAGLDVMKSQQESLIGQLPKSFGFATGISFREPALLIGPNNEEKVRANMIFVVHMGLSTVSNGDSSLGMLLSDTVLVTDDAAECLTDTAKKRPKNLAVRLQQDESAQSTGDNNKENQEATLLEGRSRRSVLLTDQTRNKTTNEDKRRDNQRKLAAELNERAKARLADRQSDQTPSKAKKSNTAYKSVSALPDEPEIATLKIYVDKRAESIIVPIFGMAVPIHVSMIKNVSLTTENDTYLRINLSHPASATSKDATAFPQPEATFIKELTYRSSNIKEPGELAPPASNLHTAFRLIKEMQKRFKTREAEAKEKEGAVQQDKLQLAQGRPTARLKDLYVRPNIIAKRTSGTLESHFNGFRYTSLRGDKIDVLYNNIRHAFFQPCDKEMIVLLHFHLKDPVMYGKKKYKDIQFYTEVGEITTDLAKYHHMQDRDDIYAEQAERELRHKLNLAFQQFCEKVEKQTNGQVEFDQPFSELSFLGVPFRASVRLQPTSACLVSLVEWPPFVVTLDDVELVHFERVSFQLKNFDLVIIFKDYQRKTEQILQIPMESIDGIKDWLNSCEIRYTGGMQSLNWAKIMKTINDDPEHFFEDGGWNFLGGDSENEAEQSEDSADEDDAYQPSESASAASADSSEASEEGSDAVSEDDDQSGSESLGSDESSGKSWSELEEDAKRADRAHGSDDEEQARMRDKKRKHSHHSPKHSHHSPKHSHHSPKHSPKKSKVGQPPSKKHRK